MHFVAKLAVSASVLLLSAACSATSESAASSSAAIATSSRWTNDCGDDDPLTGCAGCTLPGDVRAWWQGNGGLRLLGYLVDAGPRVSLNADGSVTDGGRLYDTWVFERYILQRKDVGLQGMLVGSIKVSRGSIGAIDDPTESKDAGFLSGFRNADCSGETFSSRPLPQPVRGAFCDFFQSQGRVGVVGLPVTGLRRENGPLVQYFERMRLEWSPRAGVAPASVTPLSVASCDPRRPPAARHRARCLHHRCALGGAC